MHSFYIKCYKPNCSIRLLFCNHLGCLSICSLKKFDILYVFDIFDKFIRYSYVEISNIYNIDLYRK